MLIEPSAGEKARNDDYRRFCADLRVTDPHDDMIRIVSTKGGLLTQSYSWILQHENFRRWELATDKNKLLWIKGDPGKGKTMLLCGIVKELEKTDITPVYFFCQATDIQLNTATNVLRGLLYTLVRQHPSLFDLFREKHEDAGKSLFEDRNAWTVLCEMLQTALDQEILQNVVLVIDALDECTTDIDRLVGFIIDISSRTKIIASSRNWISIQNSMADAQDKVPICLELSPREVAQAVTAFIDARVSLLTKFDDETRNMIRSHLMDNSDDTFLWVALVCRQLENSKTSARLAPRMMKEFPPGLDELYIRMLDGALSCYDKDICRQILAVVSIVYRPVNLAELMSLIGIENEASVGTQWFEDCVSECGSLLVIKEGTVNFVHQSAKDFLMREEVIRRVMPKGMGQEHHYILSTSFEAMQKTLRNNIYDVELPGTSIDKIRIPHPDPLAPIRYSCLHWTDHVEGWNPTMRRHAYEILAFLEKHFLQWVEARSLIRTFGEGIGNLQKLLRLSNALDFKIRERESGMAQLSIVEIPHLTTFVQDALRFMRHFRKAIENSPLQVYPSLVFSPAKSLIKDVFQNEEPAWIARKPEVDEHWYPLLQEFKTPNLHHEAIGNIESMVFSSDGTTLASSSDQGTIDLWNTATGHFIRIAGTVSTHVRRQTRGFKKPTHARSVTFSPNDTLLLSAWTDGAIQIWDVANKQHFRTFHGHDGQAHVAIFATGGNLVASAGADRAVKIWETATGHCLHTFNHPDVLSITFSPKDDKIASMSERGVIKVWNLQPVVQPQEIESEIEATPAANFSSIIFSDRLGTEIIALSTYIRRFNTLTGKMLDARYLKTDSFNAVAMSKSWSQRKLAFVDDSPNVTLLDPNTCNVLGTIPGVKRPITSMAFTSDGLWLATSSNGPEIKIWDTALAMTPPQQKMPNKVQRAARAVWNWTMPSKHVEMKGEEMNRI